MCTRTVLYYTAGSRRSESWLELKTDFTDQYLQAKAKAAGPG